MLTENEIAAALALHNERVSWKKVAERMGKTTVEIQRALVARGIMTRVGWTSEDEDRALELYRGGKSYKEIGDELSRTAHSVATKLSWLLGGYRSSRKDSPAIVLHGWGPVLLWPTRPRREEKGVDEEEGFDD